MRIWSEGKFRWGVMENVDTPQTREFMAENYPEWDSIQLRDWDCGGFTSRTRRFWFNGVMTPIEPPMRPGEPYHSVLATSWMHRTHKKYLHSNLDPNQAAYLQGYPHLAHSIITHLPDAIPQHAKGKMAVHLLGNGVPHAMGAYIAKWVLENT